MGKKAEGGTKQKKAEAALLEKPLKPGGPDWKARVAAIVKEESTQPARWFYVSFAGEQFLGAPIILGQGPATALQRTRDLGINPGGEAAMTEIGPPAQPCLTENLKPRL
jgi:hypothetical protein